MEKITLSRARSIKENILDFYNRDRNTKRVRRFYLMVDERDDSQYLEEVKGFYAKNKSYKKEGKVKFEPSSAGEVPFSYPQSLEDFIVQLNVFGYELELADGKDMFIRKCEDCG